MHPRLQFLRQNGINHPVPLDPRLAPEGRRNNLEAKMAFPIGPRPRMARVLGGFIDYLQKIGGKCRNQLGLQGFSYQS